MQACVTGLRHAVERWLHFIHAPGRDGGDRIAIETGGRGAAQTRVVEQAEYLGRTRQAHGVS